jgi:hypothetical protein
MMAFLLCRSDRIKTNIQTPRGGERCRGGGGGGRKIVAVLFFILNPHSLPIPSHL